MTQTITLILSIATPTIVLLGAAFVMYNQVKTNSSKVSAEVIATYKEQVAQLKEEVRGCHEMANKCQSEIASLRATLEEKEKQIKSYEIIFANRNPKLEEILTNILNFMQKLEKRMGFAEDELKKQTILLNQ